MRNLLTYIVIFAFFIFTNSFIVPDASAKSNVSVVLYTHEFVKDFTSTQTIKLLGQVIYHTEDGGIGIPGVYYAIIDVDTGSSIADGYADNRGMFESSWQAGDSSNLRKLKAVFYGNSQYPSAESNVLELKIQGARKPPPPLPPTDTTYYNTNISLEVTEISSGKIKVKPIVTYGQGYAYPFNNIDGRTNFIDIYIDEIYTTSVVPGQWSDEISISDGSHTVFAFIIETRNLDKPILYRSSRSNTVNVNIVIPPFYYTDLELQIRDLSTEGYIQVYPKFSTVQGTELSNSEIQIYVDNNYVLKTLSNQWSKEFWMGNSKHTVKASIGETTDTSNSLIKYSSASDSQTHDWSGIVVPTNTNDDQTLTYIIAAAVLGGIGAVVGSLKLRKKAIHVVSSSLQSSVPLSDDTQFYGCPTCNSDTTIQFGKQYCPKCRKYI